MAEMELYLIELMDLIKGSGPGCLTEVQEGEDLQYLQLAIGKQNFSNCQEL